MKKKILIEGMSCHNCVHHVTETLSELIGVSNVSVKLEEKYALADIDSNVKDEDIKAAVSEAGYEIVGIEVM
ncbi:heavy-metal-associated domain-containing protein [Tissierella carlieri]|uniref:Heavy-metal-associated domain-containing protein n=1 Tax=Tissierella carlieri TaxID=689904 RepID=A0ABT1SE02_9FIRM|nr:heavy-metal-associated domain-containing protein [Tissierella carlieri]MBU5313505.1 heavy-metal-associated domain-containing protein [Tissierella carlieri]MCQ4924708.1 heavy-metal-associated domain-containing protein [Tissierella carlieri]